jgi:hypothetical protein
MPVVDVGVMRMTVGERGMHMGMGMRFTGRVIRPVVVLMMVVMDVPMCVRQSCMPVAVAMTFGQM